MYILALTCMDPTFGSFFRYVSDALLIFRDIREQEIGYSVYLWCRMIPATVSSACK